MPIIHIEEFETSLLTLFGVSLVLWRRKADSALSNPCFMTLPPNFTTSEFPITSLLKSFVRSRRDWKKKMPARIPTTVNYPFNESNSNGNSKSNNSFFQSLDVYCNFFHNLKISIIGHFLLYEDGERLQHAGLPV
jgi:hypothetical protein